MEDDTLEKYWRRDDGHGLQEVLQGHKGPGERDEGVEHVQGSGDNGEEHADLTESSGRATKQCYQVYYLRNILLK